MISDAKFQCPICLRDEAQYLMDYTGSFLECSELHQCRYCEIIFAYPLPDLESLNNYYAQGVYTGQNRSNDDNDIREFSYKLSLSRIDLIKESISYSKNQIFHIIDIGAGNAIFGKAFLEYYQRVKYDIVEPNKALAKTYGSYVTSTFSDINEVPTNSYDLVVMNQVLEHVLNPVDFINAAANVLKRGGYLYIDVPYKDYIFKESVSPHLYFYTIKSLSTIIKEAGFSIEFCDSAGMSHSRAVGFFSGKRSFIKLLNPWVYLSQLSRILKRCGINIDFDTFKQFQATQYGGDRQWLRCVAKKRN